MSANELLIWARGPGLDIALLIFVFGMLLRLFEIVSLGSARDLSEQRGSGVQGGIRTLWSRSFPRKELFAVAPLRIANGYVMHIGLLAVIFFHVPHIVLIENLIGISWPGLPGGVIDALTAVTLLSMGGALAFRLGHPVMRFLSTSGDYFAWVVTLLPVLTGYLAFNHLLLPYTLMLALHILSVELLLIVAPFSKLTHMFGFALARWYQGYRAGHRGVES
jgi:nitrate reductase gamma subunit